MEKRTKIVTILLTSREVTMLDAACDISNKSKSSFIRDILREELYGRQTEIKRET